MEKKMSESSTKVIRLPMPYKKQREILLDPHRFKVLNLGRRCVVGDSLVDMADGKQKKIKYIKVGDLVKTSVGPKRVVHTFRTCACPCPMLKLDIGGKIYETTYDHKYLTREGYVPAIIIAWGIMDASERKKFKLLCEQYGETVNDEIQRWVQNSGDETCERCEWIFANSNGWEDNKSSQGSSRDFCDEPREQTLRGPYRQQQSEQQSGKLTMGDTTRERIISERKGEACRRERGGEISECEDDGKTSISSIRVNGEIHTDIRKSSKNSKRSRSNVEPSTRYFTWENLEIRSATVGEYEEVYDITVEGVHNYSLNGLIVHNTGKSTLAACKAFLHAVETGYSSLIISDTMEHARDIYWNEILPQTIPEVWATKNENLLQYKIKPVKFDLPVAKFWGHDIHADYTAQTKTPLIKLKGVDKNPDALRGGKYGFIVIDEAAFAECDLNDVFRKVLRPMVADTGGEIWIVSTPNGTMNHFFTFATLAQNDLEPDWGYFHATALDNPYFDPKGTGEWESIKRAYERAGKIGDWQQEYMAEFAQPESLVFSNFDPKIHIIKDLPDMSKFNHFAGIDYGFNDPFAVVFIAVHPRSNTWFVYDEIYEQHTTNQERCDMFKQKAAGDYFQYIVGDCADPTSIKEMNSGGVRVRPCKKYTGAKSERYGVIRSQLELRETQTIDGIKLKPKLYISAHCKNYINEMMGIAYKKDKWGELTDIIDPRFPDHLLDATAYLIDMLRNGGTPPKKAQHRYSKSGRRLD